MTYGIVGYLAHSIVTGFAVLPIGAGGWLTGTSMSADGTTKLVRTDTHGAYRFNSSSGLWEQLNTLTSMGVNASSSGVYEICVAPSDPSIAYMMVDGKMFKSTNINTALAANITWTLLTGFTQVTIDANDAYRTFGRKMAVDPSNTSKVYVGTASNGVWVTTDGGSNWTQVSTASIPLSTSVSGIYPGHTITFLNSSTIYITSYGSQMRVSTNSGGAWTATTSGPTTHQHTVVGSNGLVWTCEDRGAAPTDNVWRYSGGLAGAWTQQSTLGMNVAAIAIDPLDATHVVFQHPQGAFAWTTTGSASPPTYLLSSGPPFLTRNATDVPWLARVGSSEANALSIGDLQFDPVVSGKLWCGDGLGVWTTTSPSGAGSNQQWTSVSAGIEQVVSQDFVASPGGQVYYLGQDRPVFSHVSLAAYPSTYYDATQNSVNNGYSLDYAMNDSNFAVLIARGNNGNLNAKTTDGGSNWTTFTDPTGSTIGGQIAVSTALNWVMMPSNNSQNIYYTKNGGSTWSAVGITTTQNGSDWGWQRSTIVRPGIQIAADKNTANKFYAYNFNPSANGGGVYVSVNSGDTWTKIWSGPIPLVSDGTYGALKSIPGVPGQLLWCAGGASEPVAFLRFTDDGLGTSSSLTRSTIATIDHVSRFGFGATVPGHSYPLVFAVTDVANILAKGVYMSADNCATWTLLGANPLNSTDSVLAIDGDKVTYGRCYIGFGGSGAAYYNP